MFLVPFARAGRSGGQAPEPDQLCDWRAVRQPTKGTVFASKDRRERRRTWYTLCGLTALLDLSCQYFVFAHACNRPRRPPTRRRSGRIATGQPLTTHYLATHQCGAWGDPAPSYGCQGSWFKHVAYSYRCGRKRHLSTMGIQSRATLMARRKPVRSIGSPPWAKGRGHRAVPVVFQLAPHARGTHPATSSVETRHPA